MSVAYTVIYNNTVFPLSSVSKMTKGSTVSKHGITVTNQLYETLESIRSKEGKRSVAETVDFLASEYKENHGIEGRKL